MTNHSATLDSMRKLSWFVSCRCLSPHFNFLVWCCSIGRVSLKQTKKMWVRTETNRSKICFICVSVCFVKPKTKISVCFGVSNLYRNNWNKQNSRDIKTLCFDIELKQPRNKLFWNKPKQTGKPLNVLRKIPKYATYQTVSVGLLFVSVQSKHWNSLFRYRSETTETNILFWIVPKLVSVPVSVLLNRNRRTLSL
jgi:hypothetical protein